VLAGCSSRTPQHQDVRPRDVSNLCAIFADNPHWATAAGKARDRWGTPVDLKMAIIWRESTFRPTARPVRYVMGVPAGYASSAFGFAQAIDGTWDWYVRDTGRRNADRTNFADAIDFVGWYMNKTAQMTGVPLTDAAMQYLAYHEGQTGFNRGTWRSKPWLQQAAVQVQAQAVRYRAQAQLCGMT
jgi:hypothetical protein